MKLLLINSGERSAFTALINDGISKVYFASEFINTEKNSDKTPDKLIHCLEKLSKEIDLNSTDAIAVTTGPGSFTGIRVGLSLAKGIAFGTEKKIIPINNFELILNRINDILHDKTYCVIIEAKLPEYYYSVYNNGKFVQSGADILENLQNFLKNDTIIVGDFDDETQLKHCYFEYINVKNHKNELDAMAHLAKVEFGKGHLYDASVIEPLYMKDFNFKKT